MIVLNIQPLASGWSLEISGVTNELLFKSGGAAEAAARSLAARLAAEGEAVKLVIRLRDGSIGARLLFPPGEARREVAQLAA